MIVFFQTSKTQKSSFHALSLLSLFFSCLLSSCGYHLGRGQNELTASYTSLSVPYIIGDLDGHLTSAVIKEIVSSGAFNYQRNGGALKLNIEKINLSEKNIGFRYDRKKRGKLTKDTIPTEARITLITEVSLVETISFTTLIGPIRLSASIDYDHDYYSSRNGINIFSLGQLSDLEEAYDAVKIPLNHAMAKKIVDYLNQSW